MRKFAGLHSVAYASRSHEKEKLWQSRLSVRVARFRTIACGYPTISRVCKSVLANRHRLSAAKVASPYFRQDEALVRFVLTQPPDRVSYRMLTPTDEDLEKIMNMGLKAGILEKRIQMKDLVDRSFIPTDIQPAAIDVP